VMEAMLKYIIDKHGSVPNYLKSIGVTPEMQAKIRENLLEK